MHHPPPPRKHVQSHSQSYQLTKFSQTTLAPLSQPTTLSYSNFFDSHRNLLPTLALLKVACP